MKIFNTGILFIEIVICITILCGYKLALGNGALDNRYFGLFYLGVVIHLVWTIRQTIKQKSFKLLAIIFGLITICFLLKASILRGSDFPWDGDIVVNHGNQKPTTGNKIIYKADSTFLNDKDTAYKIILPDPGKKYLTTLWVSDPECTGCNDCMIDSGKLLIPDTLKRFVKDPIGNHILFLDGKSPYDIEGEAYVRYQIKGQVTGVRNGRLVFYVSAWSRL